MTNAEAEELIQRTAAQLGEHFDAVQIMVSWNQDCTTAAAYRGVGNWYARQGMAHEFINTDQAQIQGREVARALPRPPEEREEA